MNQPQALPQHIWRILPETQFLHQLPADPNIVCAIDIETTGLSATAKVLHYGELVDPWIVSIAVSYRKSTKTIKTILAKKPSIKTIQQLVEWANSHQTVVHYAPFETQWLNHLSGNKVKFNHDTCTLASIFGEESGRLKDLVKKYFRDDYAIDVTDNAHLSDEQLYGLYSYNCKDAYYTLLLFEKYMSEPVEIVPPPTMAEKLGEGFAQGIIDSFNHSSKKKKKSKKKKSKRKKSIFAPPKKTTIRQFKDLF